MERMLVTINLRNAYSEILDAALYQANKRRMSIVGENSGILCDIYIGLGISREIIYKYPFRINVDMLKVLVDKVMVDHEMGE